MMNVLIIDDDRETREVLRTYLHLKDDVRLRVEKRGSRAAKCILHHKFDVIVTALHQGPVSNCDVARLLAAQNPDTQLLIVGKGSCSQSLCTIIGPHGWLYLKEPVSLDRIVEAINWAFDRARRASDETKRADKYPSPMQRPALDPSLLAHTAQQESEG